MLTFSADIEISLGAFVTYAAVPEDVANLRHWREVECEVFVTVVWVSGLSEAGCLTAAGSIYILSQTISSQCNPRILSPLLHRMKNVELM